MATLGTLARVAEIQTGIGWTGEFAIGLRQWTIGLQISFLNRAPNGFAISLPVAETLLAFSAWVDAWGGTDAHATDTDTDNRHIRWLDTVISSYDTRKP